MKLGKIYDYRNKEEAKKLIGKKVLATDYLSKIEKRECPISTFLEVLEDSDGLPFIVKNEYGGRDKHQFIREIEEEEKPLMTNRQLAEWLAKGNGQMVSVNEKKQIDSLDFIFTHYNFREREGGESVGQNIRIRSWDSNEWVMPTVDIYGKDCKGIRTIE